MSVWFVTPAYQRFELTAICLEQRRHVIEALSAAGVEAHQVVIADDANLDIARSLGFDVVEQNNEWLGRKFNDGQEYAGKHGAEWIVPIGSDSWVDPRYFLPLPFPRLTRTSGMYAPVEPDRLAELKVGHVGAGPHMFHRSLMAPVGFRPAPDEINRNTDHNSVRGFRRAVRWEWRDLHPLQYVGFRVPPFITHYDRLWRRWGVVERTDPWERLATVYPADLVERARRLMVLEAVA
jgi:hypothetical protein